MPVPDAAPAAGAPRGRRLGAWGVDTALLVAVAGLLAAMTWGRLHALLVDDLWWKALTATGGLLLSGGDAQQAAEDFGAGVWATISSDIQQALLLLVLAELLYHFAAQAWAGRTLGKAALDLRVDAANDTGLGKAQAFRRALVTTAGGTGLYCLAWVLLLEGLFFLSLVVWFAALAVFVANSAPALIGRRRRTLADLVAGTAVVRAGAYRRAAELAVQGAGMAWDGTQAAGQVAGQAVRENAARLAQAEQMRRALESEQARRLQDLGRQSAGKVRDAMTGERSQQVQDMGKRLGGRLKNAYEDRRAARTDQPGPLPPAVPPAVAGVGQQPALPPPQPYHNPYVPPQGAYAQYPQAYPQATPEPPYANQPPYAAPQPLSGGQNETDEDGRRPEHP
ncbi:RDD family protein [Actinomadura fibrosa]|uniref:RDD family protein n=1 Tax=Actinomadura fibrosa TaxID=111802 RepID=UPI0013F1446C|nr:RDD family protein [Actinomadura fibrosa]